MKIASFNINGINRRLPNLMDWLADAAPDVVCLQELKASDRQFPASALADAGYGAVWKGEASWNGVAILARGAEPILTRDQLPGDPSDRQARYIEAAVNGVLIGCLYAPNGNPQPGPKFDYKLKWLQRMLAHAQDLWATELPVALVGDYNIVPDDRDIYPTTSYRTNALVQPGARAIFARLLDQGWTDAIRHMRPDETIYTFWDYMRNRWERNAGLRIDHVLVSAPLVTAIQEVDVDQAMRGKSGASDHVPVWVQLKL